jgi:hypothetical protein
MGLTSLMEYLDTHKVPYIVITHSTAYTAQGIVAVRTLSEVEDEFEWHSQPRGEDAGLSLISQDSLRSRHLAARFSSAAGRRARCR